jgi:hypothetical protein
MKMRMKEKVRISRSVRQRVEYHPEKETRRGGSSSVHIKKRTTGHENGDMTSVKNRVEKEKATWL